MLFMVLMYVNGNRLVPYGLTFKEFWREDWLFSLQFYAISYFVYYSIQYFNKSNKENQNGYSRFIKEVLFIIIVGFILQEFFRTIFIKFIVRPEDPKTLSAKLRLLQMVNVAAILVQYSFMTSMRIFNYLQQKQLEIIRLQKEYTQSQFEALKNQLNPHFLFNSLSVLSSLVYVDEDIAEQFIEKLSKTYRYLLEQRDREKIDVTNEIDFLRNYIFLLEQRFGKKVQVTIHDDYKKGFLVPHSMLIAMEYIISSNIMSQSKPLVIDIDTTPRSVQITYNPNPKTTIENASNEQLQQLQKRYLLVNRSAILAPQSKGELTTIQFPFV
jgi:hypothetical protein